jgi:hypothetical protein
MRCALVELVAVKRALPTKPFRSLAGTVVSFAGPGNVDLVLVDGVVRKSGGRLIGTDYEAIAADAEHSRESLLNKLGVSLDDIRFDRGHDRHLARPA